jgi:hypothetical protein
MADKFGWRIRGGGAFEGGFPDRQHAASVAASKHDLADGTVVFTARQLADGSYGEKINTLVERAPKSGLIETRPTLVPEPEVFDGAVEAEIKELLELAGTEVATVLSTPAKKPPKKKKSKRK